MERLAFILSFIGTGWVPFFTACYLTYDKQYAVAAVCFLTSFCGFKQMYDNLRNEELFKELNKKIKLQQQELEQKKVTKNGKNTRL